MGTSILWKALSSLSHPTVREIENTCSSSDPPTTDAVVHAEQRRSEHLHTLASHPPHRLDHLETKSRRPRAQGQQTCPNRCDPTSPASATPSQPPSRSPTSPRKPQNGTMSPRSRPARRPS